MQAADFIDSVSFGYRAVWRERSYLLRLALVPMAIKLVCIVAISVMDLNDNILRQAIVMLPSGLAEGWLLAQFLRTLLFHERWPIGFRAHPPPRVMAALILRARGILSAAILYALIGYLRMGLLAMIPAADIEAARQSPETASPFLFFLSLLILYVSLWLFRSLWLYIPAVALMPVRDFLARTRGLGWLLKIFGIFLVTVVPPLMVGSGIAQILGNGYAANFLTVLVGIVIDTIKDLIATAAMAYAFRGFLPKAPGALPDFEKE